MFFMRFTGTDSDIDLATEHPEFSAWKWVPIEALPGLIVSFKRQIYLDLLAEFDGLSRLSAFLADPVVQLMMAADSVTRANFTSCCVRSPKVCSVAPHPTRMAKSRPVSELRLVLLAGGDSRLANESPKTIVHRSCPARQVREVAIKHS